MSLLNTIVPSLNRSPANRDENRPADLRHTVKPLYEMQKSMEAKRLQISRNTELSEQQRSQALQSLGIEQQQAVQRLLGDVTFRQ
jgi:hypothetical protein